ncbi:A/B/D/E cyclin [Hyphopichia burtonii NRRL Y-1933]|uniref:A/B/D/E cyclin n=1 Tax=Hyphopichia burtonii NRRL Y-1933 TaxID=984485 RepID=A0A1E4RBS9_9ASCO|nr:A/B/D/E cyclin [Hyphopichia burtonii NRRL Y-1933]ODV64717.1 A/B/D/E cyclin [Hyphopichia burtonii NRRL Y-1933]
MSSINNENEYRLTRSKSLASQRQQLEQKKLKLHHNHKPESDTVKNSEDVIVSTNSTRPHLADVSNQFGVSGSKSITNSKDSKDSDKKLDQQETLAPPVQVTSSTTTKRRPLAGDLAPLTQQTSSSSNSNNKVSKIPSKSNNKRSSTDFDKENDDSKIMLQPSQTTASNISASKKNNLLVPNRKRQATESSSNLVEKLHTTNELNNSNKFKKSKRIDYEWQDLDEEDFDDPLMVSEYVNDIFPYLNELEYKTLPDADYLYKQTQLKPRMRSILVDWLVEMHQRFRLLPETLFLAINIMDRFMSLEVVQIDKLQLLATGSLFIAAKYEEVFSPSVKNYAYFTDGSYTEDEILQAEKYILTILDFELNYPNPMNFLRRISKADDYDVQSRTLGKYLLEITIMDYKFIGMLPSLCSASAMYIARLILGKDPVWNGNLIHYSGGYKVSDMKECINLIMEYLIAPVEHDEFFKKYATRKFMKASIVCRGWARKFISEERDLFDPNLITDRIPK